MLEILAGACIMISCKRSLVQMVRLEQDILRTVEEMTMKAVVLSDNIPWNGLNGEWGLSIYITYRDKRILLDSGAFTFFSSGKSVDWNGYLKRYIDFINKNNVEKFFELDIDPLVGYVKVLEFRRILEENTGKRCIPVWHKSRGKEDFLKMCEEYDYVAIGGIVTKEIKANEYRYFPWFINEAHKRGAKIHGLGFTNLEGLTKYKFDSVDSTSWTSGNRFGAIYTFDGKTMRKTSVPKGMRLADSRETAIRNFNEWVKFQKYAERHL